MKTMKRILEVKIKHMPDESPDTSYLGEYSNTRSSDFSIDRKHSLECASVLPASKAEQMLVNARGTVSELLKIETESAESEALEDAYQLLDGLAESMQDCDCDERGDMNRGEYRYFNPSFNYVDKFGKPLPGNTSEEVREYVRQDYERMQAMNRGDWAFMGISAEASVQLTPQGPIQRISSGGLWGIESDSGQDHLSETEREELSEMKEQLKALGFTDRAIVAAFESFGVPAAK